MSAASEHDDVRLVREPIGFHGQRTVVTERHELSRRYPESLMAPRRVRIRGYAVHLDLEMAGDPEAAALGRRVFQKLRDSIEDAIRHLYLDAGPKPESLSDEKSSHGLAASRDGAGSVGGSPAPAAQPGAGDLPEEPS